jgi:hypothetical protein
MSNRETPDFENRLYELYPDLLCGLKKPIRESCMYFGFEIGEGWKPLIEKLLKDIQEEIVKSSLEHVEVLQVKEKWGGLRFYIQGDNDAISEMVGIAEDASYKICEKCGEVGEATKKGWIKVLCPKHMEERYNGNG